MQGIRIAFWTAVLITLFFGLGGLVQAQPPKACINGWVSDNQAHYIIRAAQELGWDVYWSEKNERVEGCSVYFIRGDADTWLQNGRMFTFKGMSVRKARQALRGWQRAQNITSEVVVNNGRHANGYLLAK